MAGMDRKHRYWFAAKRFGWGWGLPATWQGWCVLLVFLALVVIDAVFVLPRYGRIDFYAVLLVFGVGLMIVCWSTGAPPHWRRGGE